MLRTALALVVTSALAAGAAHAERVVALAPLSTLGAEDTSASTRKATAAIEAAIAALPGTRLVPAAKVAEAIRAAKKPQLRACEGDVACLAELGQLAGAQLVIAGQVGGLGESRVVYLNLTDVAAKRELRSTTLAVGGKEDPKAPTGAVTQLLDPDRYRGTVKLAFDVSGATVYVNGTKVAPSKTGELALPVGAQAVRVTHPEYRDFVRFVDVKFGRTVEVPVAMTQYPIVARDLQGRPINRDKIEYIQPPLWRRWYVVGPAAVGLAIVAGVIAAAIANDEPDVPCRTIGNMGSC